MARALLLDLRARHVVAGGSTISQQTAKIVYTSQERTMSRKLTELMDAAGLEKSLSKKQILELYLNRIYLGSAAYGVDGAAHVYFGTSARNLDSGAGRDAGDADARAVGVLAPPRSAAGAAARQPGAGCDGGDRRHHRGQAADDARAHPAVIIDRASTGRAQLSSSTPPPTRPSSWRRRTAPRPAPI